MLPTDGAPVSKARTIGWREWSKDAFEDAKRENKLVLLDLSASWCHWCHVMDQSTYSDPEIVKTINDSFVAIRVDIDKRPDISERYNRGGFPTTAFLSDQGESIWGATYLPPSDMKRIIRSIMQAKRSGEIDQALERSRMHYLDLSKALEPKNPIGPSDLDEIFEDIFASYDVGHGGFGIEPKFPNPDVIELLLNRYASDKDDEIVDAVVQTLDAMIDGLYDKWEGGVFRYSVTRNWRTPHYEKMLETNLGFLKNLVHAYAVTDTKRFEEHARGTARYLMTTLRDQNTGSFFGSQDADEEYYKLSGSERTGRKVPSVDRTVYAGWNARAVSTLIVSGKLLNDDALVDAGIAAWRHLRDQLWNGQKMLIRHTKSSEDYLFEDQAAFFEALLTVLEATGDDSLPALAEQLVSGVDGGFSSDEGGYNDVLHISGAIGELGNPRRSLVDNSKWARTLILFGAGTRRPDLIEKAKGVLASFTRRELEAYGIFGSAYLIARWALEHGPITVEVHAKPGSEVNPTGIFAPAKILLDPATVVMGVADETASEPFAIVCTKEKCLPKAEHPETLSQQMDSLITARRR